MMTPVYRIKARAALILVVLVHRASLGSEGFDLSLPFLAHLVELLVGALIGGHVLEDVFHIDEGKLLCHRRLRKEGEESEQE